MFRLVLDELSSVWEDYRRGELGWKREKGEEEDNQRRRRSQQQNVKEED